MEDVNELEKMVIEISDEIYELIKEERIANFYALDSDIHLHIYNNSKCIIFSDFTLWDSNDDDRQINDDGEYEPLKPFLKRRINELAQVFSKIILKEGE